MFFHCSCRFFLIHCLQNFASVSFLRQPQTKGEFYLFYYNAIFKHHVLFKQTWVEHWNWRDCSHKTCILIFAETYVSEKKKVNVIVTITIEYAWICLNKQSFEIDKVLNIPDEVHSQRSLYKILSTLWDRSVFRTLSDSLDGILWKNNYPVTL